MANSNQTQTSLDTEFNSLLHAIGTGSCPSVQKLLTQNPGLVKLQAWHGMTALHRACLSGDYNVILLLLRAGADPNAPNITQETPTLFACKRGSTVVLNLMIEFGGDVRKIDTQGRGAMIHAAESGVVSTLHYLDTVCNLDFRFMDLKLRTPLHVACLFGNMEAVKYLIRKNRCDLMKVNSDGETPLHVLAREGQSHLCWLLLMEVGTSALRAVNNGGYTPTDLADQRDKMGHREITPILKYYSKHPEKKPCGPYLLWYWWLLMPTLVFGVGVFISNKVNGYLHTVTILSSLICILYYKTKQIHRIEHVSRWPNPIYAGIFGAGIIHTFIVVCVQLTTYIIMYSILLLITVTLTVLLLFLCWKVLTADPGRVKESCYDSGLQRELTVLDLCSPGRNIQDFCADCEIVRPNYTKHCKLCNECYYYMDHHCLFLLRCIARHNQFYFVWFITICLTCMCLFVCIAVFHFQDYYSGSFPVFSAFDVFLDILQTNFWLLSLIILNSASIFWGVNVLRIQFDGIANGFTTYFRPQGYNQILTRKEKWMNSLYFMLSKKPYVQNPLHNQKLTI